MKNYFLLRGYSDPEVLGVNNGICQARITRARFRNPQKYDLLMETLGSNAYWEKRDSIRDMALEAEAVELLPKAKLTDLLKYGPYLLNCPFLISPVVAGILAGHRICDHQLFPATVTGGRHSYPYSIPHIPALPDECVDFSRSVFYTGCGLGLIGDKQYHTFSSAAEMHAYRREHTLLQFEKVVMSRAFDADLDLFVTGNSDMVISERLKQCLDDAGVTGVKILPAFGDVPWTKVHGPG